MCLGQNMRKSIQSECSCKLAINNPLRVQIVVIIVSCSTRCTTNHRGIGPIDDQPTIASRLSHVDWIELLPELIILGKLGSINRSPGSGKSLLEMLSANLS